MCPTQKKYIWGNRHLTYGINLAKIKDHKVSVERIEDNHRLYSGINSNKI